MCPWCGRSGPDWLHKTLVGLQRVALGDEQLLTAQVQRTPSQALQGKRLAGKTRGAKIELHRTIARLPGPIGLYSVPPVHSCLSALYRQA